MSAYVPYIQRHKDQSPRSSIEKGLLPLQWTINPKFPLKEKKSFKTRGISKKGIWAKIEFEKR